MLGGALNDANFASAVVNGAHLWNGTARGFSRDQLYSTASYQAKDLSRVSLGVCDLSGWDLSGQNLADVSFRYAILAGTDFRDSIVKGAEFGDSRGFTKEMLYSTASYQAKDLGAIELTGHDLSG